MLEQLVGQSLDRYEIVELLGEGGMGAVFRARDAALQRDVAVKVMQPQAARLPNFQERFLQEARTAARLDHPNVVKVFDFGQDRGLLYIVMEYIRGDNLRTMLDDLKGAGQWIPLAEGLQLVRQLCLAIDYAHRQGILHRDIKPDNVMLKPEPADGLPYRPVLTDLGLAKLLESQGGLTQDGTSMGTPSYMSPEQAMGEKTDARSDVYSLGILLYELAAGRLPFPIKTLTEAIRYHTKEPPPPPRSVRPDLPEQVESLILKALAKDPAARFADASHMARALGEALSAPEAAEAAAPTLAGAVGLMTQYQQSLERPRGPSILREFPQTPADLGQDRISILAPNGSVRTVPIKGPELTIGRTADVDVVLDDSKVSRRHARIQFDGTQYRIVDLNSTNGTYLADVKLLPGVAEVWVPDKALRVGDTWLRLERSSKGAEQLTGALAASGATMASGGVPTGGSGARRVAAFIETPDLAVEPGSSVTASVTILNQGPVVDHFQISVANLPAGWVPSLPPLIRLLPGGKQAVSLLIQPPRSPQSRAGTYPLIVRVASQDSPDQVAEVQARLTVRPYSQFRTELRPQAVRAGRAAQVRIENQGNAPLSVGVNLEDRAAELDFRPPQAQLTVAEGQVAASEFRAAPRHRPLIGGRKTHPFVAKVGSAGGEAQVATGEVVSGGLIPPWVPPLVVVPLIALCVLLISMFIKPPVIRSITVDPPSPLAGQAVTVHWEVDNAQSVELRPLVGDLDPKAGQYTFAEGLATSTSFTLVAINRFGSSEQPVTIGVVAPEPGAPLVEEWSIFPTTLIKGQPVTIRWRVSNAESVTLQPFGTVESAGEVQDTPQQTMRYTLLANNKGKTVEKSQEVVVELPAPEAPIVTSFTADPKSILKGAGGTIRLSWDTQKADSVAIEPGIGPVGPVGYRDVPAPAATTAYTLIAKNAGGETRAEVQVSVMEKLIPLPLHPIKPVTGIGAEPVKPIGPVPLVPVVPLASPTPGPTWSHAVALNGNRDVYHLRLTQAGQIKARATWSGSQGDLALIINGPGKEGYYARQDGDSSLVVSYNVSDADLAKGEEWRVTVASFGTGQANGDLEITYPSGSSVVPYKGTFVVKPNYGTSVSVLVLRRLLLNAGGTISARATWTGSPANLALILNGPGQVGYYARQDGASPLTLSYAASDAVLDRGDTWTISLVSFQAANAQGSIELSYPSVILRLRTP